MANKTFSQLRGSLIGLWGYEQWEELTKQDQDEVDTCINSALFDCFVPVAGQRPDFGAVLWGGLLKKPATAVLALTEGQRIVGGYDFEGNHAGSRVKIGDRFFHYERAMLVEPWDGETGEFPAIVFHNAVALPGTLVETATEWPELHGHGLLQPLPDGDAEARLRASPAPGITGALSVWPGAWEHGASPDGCTHPGMAEGQPLWYRVDNYSGGSRLVVYPLPGRNFTVSMRANFLPFEDGLTDGNQVPPMPLNSVDNILLPLAREKLVLISDRRRFTGNASFILEAARQAKAQLKRLARKQRHAGGGFRLRDGW